MQVSWDIDGIEIEVVISNIQWSNDSMGMTEAWGCLKDDARDDYISDFDVDEIIFTGRDNIVNFHSDLDVFAKECEVISNHKFLQDADFVAKVEDMERYE